MSTPGSQSSFVTGLAWSLIVFNALGVLVLLLQNAMVNLVMPALLESAPEVQELPLALFRSLGIAFLAISVFLTYAAYALLKRRNWARVLYIVVFALAIVSHVVSALLAGAGIGVADLATSGAGLPPETAGVARTMMVVVVVLLLATAVVFGWLIKRLRSPVVKAEFAGAQ